MERNWLIRTKKQQILGPVTKSKVLEFIDKGILKEDDELTAGNGYWFFIKETDLLDRYVRGDIPQPFNPVTETKNVLVLKEKNDSTASINPSAIPDNYKKRKTDGTLPSSGDLDFPDLRENSSMEATDFINVKELGLEASLEIKEISIEKKAPEIAFERQEAPGSESVKGKLPENDDLEFPSELKAGKLAPDVPQVAEKDRVFEVPMGETSEVKASKEVPTSAPAEKKEEKLKLENEQYSEESLDESSPTKKERKKGDKYLVYFLFLLAGTILYGAYYYYTKVLGGSFPSISSVYAQELFVKKKT